MTAPDVRRSFRAGTREFSFFSLAAAEEAGLAEVSGLPYSLKILVENLLRHAETVNLTVGEEIPFRPVRILAGDSSGVPLAGDLATMRSAMRVLGGDPERVNPVVPVDFVIDHSTIVDVAGTPSAVRDNLAREFERNRERYEFLRWAQGAFKRFRMVPPGNGILHQVNLETFAQVVWSLNCDDGTTIACPDAMVGMDSHTPMINGMGVLGWGVGAIEAAAAMLGQPLPIAIPRVIGCRLTGRIAPGVMMTDVVLTLTQALRKRGVVGAFVEFTGHGLDTLRVPERATLANMAPEYGATVGYFPIDAETLRYLQLTGRSEAHVQLVEAYAKVQGLWRDTTTPEPRFSDIVEFDLGAVEPSLAGPRRPQDRVPLAQVPASFQEALPRGSRGNGNGGLHDGDVVIAALTSCTNTSNPSVMIAAGLLARNAVARGLRAKPWVKTSLAPGSRVVTDYLTAAGLTEPLDALGFNVVGYGCTTCMGNSGPLDERIARQIDEEQLVVAAVLSGNRNFEGRIHPQAKASYLASPPLVVAYALAGSVNIDLTSQPLGDDRDGHAVYLRDVWPRDDEIESIARKVLHPKLFVDRYKSGFTGSSDWNALSSQNESEFSWAPQSEVIKAPPFLDGISAEPEAVADIVDARPLLILGDSVTTDHISPIATIHKDSPAWRYLRSKGIEPEQIGTYNLRRLNHEVMKRGTFANPRILNEMVAPQEGWFTRHMPDGNVAQVYETAMAYAGEGTAAIVVAGAEYGTGSSRDWAARGTRLLGVRAIIAESFERIHRSNLVGMGVLPLQFSPGTTRKTLGLDGSECFTIRGIAELSPRSQVECRIVRASGAAQTISLLARVDTAVELDWYRHGGILPYVLRSMLKARDVKR